LRGMTTKKERAARELLAQAIEWAGSKPGLAVEMRVSEQTIREWTVRGRVPATPARLLGMLLALSKGTKGTKGSARDLELILRG